MTIDEKEYQEFLEFKKFQEFKKSLNVVEPIPEVLTHVPLHDTALAKEIADEILKIEPPKPQPVLTHENIKFFIDKVLKDVEGHIPMLTAAKIDERMKIRFPTTRDTSIQVLNNVLNKEALNGNYRRYMVGPNLYAYMPATSSVERGHKILFNPDVKAGSSETVFYNIRGAILKHAKENKAFYGVHMVNQIVAEFFFLKEPDKKRLRTSLNTELSNLTIKKILERAGEPGNRMYSIK